MNMKLSLSFKPILAKLNKLRGFLMILAIIAIAGYTGYQISKAVAVTPTQESIAAAKEKLNPTSIRFDMPTIDSIAKHNTIKVSPDLGGLGTSNPFYGQ